MSHDLTHSHGRLHALDALRGTMMLLGLLLHTLISYTVEGLGAAWPYRDPATTAVADISVLFIHVFRMPIFFVLAGFFAAMLFQRRGASGLLSNRLQRIGIPLALGLILLYPLVIGGFTYANVAKGASLPEAWRAFLALASTPALYLPKSTIHLWFLYYLLYFYVAAVLLSTAGKALPQAWHTAFGSGFRWLLSRPALRVFLPALLTAITLLPMGGQLATRTAFMPDLAVLVAYGVFFGFGWLLYRQQDLLPGFRRLAWWQTIGATALFLGVLLLVIPVASAQLSAPMLAAVHSLTNGLVVWMLFFGITGLFLRYLDRPSARARYVVDASYWVYLVHLPCVIWGAGLLAQTALPAWGRMLIVLSSTAVIGFGTYGLFVRSSVIGAILNGRRYPRGLPAEVK